MKRKAISRILAISLSVALCAQSIPIYAAEEIGTSAAADFFAEDFIEKKLAPAYPENDGKQTPMKNHPVFIAQHACACCCRGCLEKWYKVPKGRELTKAQQEKIVNLLMAWIQTEYNNYKRK